MGKRKGEKVILGKIGKMILKIARKYFDKICIVGHNEYNPMEDDCSKCEDEILELVKKCIPERFSRTYGFKYRIISNEITDEIEKNLSNLTKGDDDANRKKNTLV